MGFALLATSSNLLAQISDYYNVDENGNGTLASHDESSVFYFAGFVYSQMAPDPSGGITNNSVLIYDLGSIMMPGDVAIIKPGESSISKLLRFYPYEGDTFLIFYSQPDGTPAGVGIPYSANPVQVTETSTPTTWNPVNSSQPGYAGFGVYPEGFSGYGYYFHIARNSEPAYLSGTNLIWNYTGAFSCLHFYVVASTNLSLPLTNWTRVSTNVCDQTGSCELTLPVNPNQPELFYRIEEP